MNKMRVPHTIPVNTLRAYAASEQTLSLAAERYRTIRAEDLSWDENTPPSLKIICIQVLAANFIEHWAVVPYLPQQDFDYYLEILSVDLPLHIVAPIVEDGLYWQRCCMNRWANRPLDVSKHSNSWKQMYIERHFEEYIHYQEPGYIDWDDVTTVTKTCAPFISNLEIRELKPPRIQKPDPDTSDSCKKRIAKQIEKQIESDHMDLNPVLSKLTNLTDLSIRFGLIDCGMKYNPEFFKISSTDIINLGEGLKKVLNLNTFRLHRSAIDDDLLTILIEALLSCPTIEILELSHCIFGDMGANVLSKLLLEHNNLKSLFIENNLIGVKGVNSLTCALEQENCCPIRILNLDFNLIKDEGAYKLSNAIVKNKTLTELYLGGTGMTSMGATKIGESLLYSSSLQKVSLCNNHLDENVAESLIYAVLRNRRLETLDVRNCDLGQEAETMVHKFITRNRRLHQAKF